MSIAESFHVPKAFIGVTIVAIGTSLPELATSIIAAMKKNTDLAIGGIVGSNIFNTLWIIGATGLINPISGYTGLNFDLSINIIATIALLSFAFFHKKMMISRLE